MSLDRLLLSCRAEGALARLGCRTVDDVARLTPRQLRDTRNCGPRSIAEIDRALRRLGRSLAADVRARTTKRRPSPDGACVQSRGHGIDSATPRPGRAGTSLPPEGGQDGA